MEKLQAVPRFCNKLHKKYTFFIVNSWKKRKSPSKPFRVLTGWLVGCQVFEVDAFDDFHREASGGGVVHQAHKDLWRGSLTDRLEWRGALAACHVWEANLGLSALKVLAENCWEFNNWSSSDEIFILIVALCDCYSSQSF